MQRVPHEHQREGLRWAIGRQKIGLLWDMRLGKSLVAIRWAVASGCKSVLVVCPADLTDNWLDELRLEGLTGFSIRGWNAAPIKPHGWYITSFQSLRNNGYLQTTPWDCVIIDESDNIRNPKTDITKTVLASFQKVPFKAILSGTPAPESVTEYVTQMIFLNGSFMGHRNFWGWRAAYCEPDPMSRWDWRLNPGVMHEFLQAVNKDCFQLTRRMAGFVDAEVVEPRRLGMPKELRKIYDHAEEFFEVGEDRGKYAAQVYTWLCRLCGGYYPRMNYENKFKIDAVKDLIARQLRSEAVVIWCRFNAEVRAIENALAKSRKVGVMTGSTPIKLRQNINKRFLQGKLDTVICNVGCGTYGRDFSSSSTTIFYSLPADLKRYLQCKARVQHPNKRESTLVVPFLARESVDEDTFHALLEKKNVHQVVRSMITKRKGRRHGHGNAAAR